MRIAQSFDVRRIDRGQRHDDMVAEFYRAPKLGDAWCYTNMLLRMADELRRDVGVCFVDGENGEIQRKRFLEILPLLDGPTHRLFVSKGPSTCKLSKGNGTERSPPYYPTKDRWSKPRGTHCVYQFDALRACRRAPEGDTEKMVAHVRALTRLEQIRMSGELSLAKCIEKMATADCFYGANSGMAHVCFSVGTPMSIVQYWNSEEGMNDFRKQFAGKELTRYADTTDFLRRWRPNA